jgi:hypothetical protein
MEEVSIAKSKLNVQSADNVIKCSIHDAVYCQVSVKGTGYPVT